MPVTADFILRLREESGIGRALKLLEREFPLLQPVGYEFASTSVGPMPVNGPLIEGEREVPGFPGVSALSDPRVILPPEVLVAGIRQYGVRLSCQFRIGLPAGVGEPIWGFLAWSDRGVWATLGMLFLSRFAVSRSIDLMLVLHGPLWHPLCDTLLPPEVQQANLLEVARMFARASEAAGEDRAETIVRWGPYGRSETELREVFAGLPRLTVKAG